MKKILFILSVFSLLGCPEREDNAELSDETELIEEEMIELLNEEQEPEEYNEEEQTETEIPDLREGLSTYQWNDLALEAYEEGDYQLATEYCYRAIATDSSYLFAHYNLSCMLNLRLKQGEDNGKVYS